MAKFQVTLFGKQDGSNKEAVELVQLVLGTAIDTIAKELSLTDHQVIDLMPAVVENIIEKLNEYETDQKLKKLFNAKS